MHHTLTLALCGAAFSAALAAAVALAGFTQYRALNEQFVSAKLGAAQSMMQDIVAHQKDALEVTSRDIANNPNFVSYIGQALNVSDAGGRDVPSIRDLLEERKQSARLDAAAILDADGQLVAAVGDPFLAKQTLASLGAVNKARQTLQQTTGIVVHEMSAPMVVVTPVARGADIQGFLVAGRRTDVELAKSMASFTGASAVVVVDGEPRLTSTSLDVANGKLLASELPSIKPQLAIAGERPHTDFTVKLDGNSWPMRAIPLHPGASAFMLAMIAPQQTHAMRDAIATPLLWLVAGFVLIIAAIVILAWRAMVMPLAAISNLSAHLSNRDFALAVQPRGFPLVRNVQDVVNQLLRELARYRNAPGTPHRRATDNVR